MHKDAYFPSNTSIYAARLAGILIKTEIMQFSDQFLHMISIGTNLYT
jgi:hypothetical protein